MIYASERYSTAMLEALVWWNGPPPGNQHYVEIEVPAGTSYEVVDTGALPDWHRRDSPSARRFGHRRSPVSVDRNFIINADHPEFERLIPVVEKPVWWDRRLFT